MFSMCNIDEGKETKEKPNCDKLKMVNDGNYFFFFFCFVLNYTMTANNKQKNRRGNTMEL